MKTNVEQWDANAKTLTLKQIQASGLIEMLSKDEGYTPMSSHPGYLWFSVFPQLSDAAKAEVNDAAS